MYRTEYTQKEIEPCPAALLEYVFLFILLLFFLDVCIYVYVDRQEVIMYFIIQKQLVTNSINRNKKQPWLNINSNKLLQLKIRRSNYNCSFDHNKKKRMDKLLLFTIFSLFFFVCVLLVLSIIHLITRSFIHYSKELY
jgi:hypothetical protein